MPELKTALLQRLRLWHTPPTHHRRISLTSLFGLRGAVEQQDQLGWYNFLMGRVGNQWVHVQQRYYEWLSRRNTGKAWVQALIQKVWSVSWDMWDHRNAIRLDTITPAQLRERAATNRRIVEEFALGPENIGIQDHHWFAKPLAHVLKYDPAHQSQWLASVELARYRHANAHEFEASSLRHPRDFMIAWTRRPEGLAVASPPSPGQTQR